ncbi:hypothetical protein ABT112_33535 [Streptomyces sp. NPDC002055]|uniref:hypothetical protein n=1 Tax=Streptomyces sp. NPDC002055 TaxID=3154534 RepID=UPI0033286C26
MVHALEVLPGGSAGPPTVGFEVACVAPDGTELRRPLPEVWAVPFEHALPVRTFASYRRQRNLPGLFHGHLKPVLLRDREPLYVKWEGTIWHSTRTDDQMKEEVARRRKRPQTGPPSFEARRRLGHPRAAKTA